MMTRTVGSMVGVVVAGLLSSGCSGSSKGKPSAGSGGASSTTSASTGGSGAGGAGSSSSSSSTSSSGGGATSSTSSSGGAGGASSSSSASSSGTGGGAGCGGTMVLCGQQCTDTATDASNCGACGHSCAGAACSGGQCAPADVATGLSEPGFVLVSGPTLYFTTYWDVWSLPTQGGTPTQLTNPSSNTMPIAPKSLVLYGNELYWTTFTSPSTGQVLGVSTDGFGLALLDDVAWARPYGLAAGSGGELYWAGGGNGMNLTSIVGAYPGGSAVGVVPAKSLIGIAVDAANAYVAGSDTGSVYQVPLAGGTIVTLGGSLDAPSYLAVDADAVYVLCGGTSAQSYTDGSIVKVPLAGGAAVTLATGLDGPSDLALDAASVYFTAGGTLAAQYQDGSVGRVPKAGGPVLTLADHQAHPAGLAVDATYVYWANVGSGSLPDGAIRSVAK